MKTLDDENPRDTETVRNMKIEDAMDLERAKRVIRDGRAGLPAWMIASAIIAMPENQDKSSLDDLLQCLRRAGSPAGNAALALYTRTNRPGGDKMESFSRNYEDWLQYLESHGFRPPGPVL